jgi:two-component system NarL family sensor kinase
MEVRDNGRGIDQEIQAKIAAGKTSGVGLRGMRERVAAIGGTFTIESNKKGTSVVVTLPLEKAAQAALLN